MFSNIPDYVLIEEDNLIELESRIPSPEPPEYDSTGSIITGEVIGYVDGKEIWVSLG